MLLKHHLDRFLDSFPKERHIDNDPVKFVHRYDDKQDREVAGFLASAFAYGNVKIVLRTVERVLAGLGPRPAQAIADFDPKRFERRFNGFYHRFNTSLDLKALLWTMRQALEKYGSIESMFEGSKGEIGDAIESFSDSMLSLGYQKFYSRAELDRRVGMRFFFPKPSQGSACKRINLFLRWMVRPYDGVDCGVWTQVTPRRLVIPLDTHIARISSYIGLTEMKSPGWSMAVDITRSLRRFSADDPLRYDFALCHLGIAGDCPRKRDPLKCRRCPIQAICRL